MKPHERLAEAVRRREHRPSLVAFITAGYPRRDTFLATLREVCEAADAVELGVPFSDPMADGMTVQRSSHGAIQQGVTLRWILDSLANRDFELAAPLLLMSYLNPLLAFGLKELANSAARVGVDGLIVPDLPYEESAPVSEATAGAGVGLVQMVTPATPPDGLRLYLIAGDSEETELGMSADSGTRRSPATDRGLRRHRYFVRCHGCRRAVDYIIKANFIK